MSVTYIRVRMTCSILPPKASMAARSAGDTTGRPSPRAVQVEPDDAVLQVDEAPLVLEKLRDDLVFYPVPFDKIVAAVKQVMA